MSVKILIFLAISVLVSCEQASLDATTQEISEKCLIRVGEDSLTTAAIRLRTAILKVDETNFAAETALYQLTQMLLNKQIAKDNGFELTQEYLALEAARIDSNTWHPEKIALVRAACDKDEALYQKLYIQESLLPRWLYSNFNWNATVHQATAAAATKRFGEVLVDQSLLTSDVNRQVFWLSPDSLWQDDKGVAMPEETDTNSIVDLTHKMEQYSKTINAQLENQLSIKVKQLNEAVADLKPGQLHPRLIELENAFWILRLDQVQGGVRQLSVLEFVKQSYFDWLAKERQKYEVEVFDTTLWNTMLEKLNLPEDRFRVIISEKEKI